MTALAHRWITLPPSSVQRKQCICICIYSVENSMHGGREWLGVGIKVFGSPHSDIMSKRHIILWPMCFIYAGENTEGIN